MCYGFITGGLMSEFSIWCFRKICENNPFFFFKHWSCISCIDSCFLLRLLDLSHTSKYLLLLGPSFIVPPRAPTNPQNNNMSDPQHVAHMATLANFETVTSLGFAPFNAGLNPLSAPANPNSLISTGNTQQETSSRIISIWEAGREKSQHA